MEKPNKHQFNQLMLAGVLTGYLIGGPAAEPVQAVGISYETTADVSGIPPLLPETSRDLLARPLLESLQKLNETPSERRLKIAENIPLLPMVVTEVAADPNQTINTPAPQPSPTSLPSAEAAPNDDRFWFGNPTYFAALTDTQKTNAVVIDSVATNLEGLNNQDVACLDNIAYNESHVRVNRRNNKSGASGIGQALPANKMASAGADWATNAVTQVKWMIGYVQGRYSGACKAWAFWKRNHYY